MKKWIYCILALLIIGCYTFYTAVCMDKVIQTSSGPFVWQGRSVKEFFQVLFKKKNPKISVIVASYNYARFLPRTLDSLVNQTYKNFEVIVVDDGSKDNSVEIIKEYVKKYPTIVRFYQHENGINKGLPATVQLAFSKTTGDYIAFLESDDYWDLNHLQEKVNLINFYADPVIISNNVHLFGNEKIVANTKIYLTQSANFAKSRQYFSLNQIQANPIPTFSVLMVKKEALEKLDFNTPVPRLFDFWLCFPLLLRYPVYYIPLPLTHWYRHADGFFNRAGDEAIQKDFKTFGRAISKHPQNKYFCRQDICYKLLFK